ncbi:FtsK/SpoIIIE domain-containing protein [Salinibacterium sp. ZJ70]|uniref:FtsK/SpoIIIE domain-containing protein n=1 Tax=Salinibacterium sp. ZJ70 TaxID=2708084 RepID=UPI0014208707|nr:FtsK/SpoIIIE domain-containing protein [Salinibacterium sp. ZJ70]
MLPETERIALPGPPVASPRAPFPYIQAVAPVVIAVVLWIMTASPLVLMFAFLGPALVIVSSIETRRSARRARQVEQETALHRVAEIGDELDARAERWRQLASARLPELEALCTSDASAPEGLWSLGRGAVPSGVVLTGGSAAEGALESAISHLRSRTATIPAAPVIVDGAEVLVDAPVPIFRAIARSLLLRAAAAHHPGEHHVTAPADETWTEKLPHRTEIADRWEMLRGGTPILRVSHVRDAPAGRDVVIRIPENGAGATAHVPHVIDDFQPALVSAPEAHLRAVQIAERARRRGWEDPAMIPDTVALRDMPLESDDVAGLAAPLGVGVDSPIVVDLRRDGPHALVAGTTGSGKSELLISWVLALAERHPPESLVFLLVDFKGGSAFAPLDELPHVVGVVSDLDLTTARRAVASLRAELRRREHILATNGARDIDALPDGVLPRLVVVVDEFAALLALDPELSAVFADIAARGRSLGLHLILCTQRPAGIVRDGVLANITIRICLRVLDPADSVAVVGTRAAAEIAAPARGRALIAAGDQPRTVQLALADAADATRVRSRWVGHTAPAARPWRDPLPAALPASFITGDASAPALTIGLVDLPEQQTQRRLVLDPWNDGAPLVIGGTGSGRTTALRMLGHAAERTPPPTEIRWVPESPAALWQALATPSRGDRTLVLVDDLDRTLAAADPEQRADLIDLIRGAVRDARRTHVALAASSRSAGGVLHGLQGVFEHRLLLRLPSRDEHLLAGGELAGFRTDRRPGSVLWRGSEAQIALPPGAEPAPWSGELPVASLADGGWAIAASHPRELADRLARAGVTASRPGGGGDVELADVETWLGSILELAAARRDGRLLLIDCSPSDHRLLTRQRGPLPPLGGGDAWHADGALTKRVRLDL